MSSRVRCKGPRRGRPEARLDTTSASANAKTAIQWGRRARRVFEKRAAALDGPVVLGEQALEARAEQRRQALGGRGADPGERDHVIDEGPRERDAVEARVRRRQVPQVAHRPGHAGDERGARDLPALEEGRRRRRPHADGEAVVGLLAEEVEGRQEGGMVRCRYRVRNGKAKIVGRAHPASIARKFHAEGQDRSSLAREVATGALPSGWNPLAEAGRRRRSSRRCLQAKGAVRMRQRGRQRIHERRVCGWRRRPAGEVTRAQARRG